MNAKEELRHLISWANDCANNQMLPAYLPEENWRTVSRALSLLAAVEDGDEIVRELRVDAVRVADKAAARITQDAQEKAALKAELASVKAHAEAMAQLLETMPFPETDPELVAYRKEFPRVV